MIASCRHVMSAQTRGAVAVGRTFFQTGVSPVQKEEEKNTGGQKKLQPSSCCSPLPRSPRRRKRRTVTHVRVVSACHVCADTGRGGSGDNFFSWRFASTVYSDSKHRQEKNIDPRSSCCGPLPRSPRRRERRTVINVRVVSARCVCIDTGRGGSGEKFFLQQPGWLRGTIF